jgi:hypothetical protein
MEGPHNDGPADFEKHHEQMTHFPTDDEAFWHYYKLLQATYIFAVSKIGLTRETAEEWARINLAKSIALKS